MNRSILRLVLRDLANLYSEFKLLFYLRHREHYHPERIYAGLDVVIVILHPHLLELLCQPAQVQFQAG